MDADRLKSAGLRCERAGDVVTVTLNRPDKLNAQTPAMWAALAEIGASLPGDIRIVVLCGAGSSFSSGLDVSARRRYRRRRANLACRDRGTA